MEAWLEGTKAEQQQENDPSWGTAVAIIAARARLLVKSIAEGFGVGYQVELLYLAIATAQLAAEQQSQRVMRPILEYLEGRKEKKRKHEGGGAPRSSKQRSSKPPMPARHSSLVPVTESSLSVRPCATSDFSKLASRPPLESELARDRRSRLDSRLSRPEQEIDSKSQVRSIPSSASNKTHDCTEQFHFEAVSEHND